MIGWMGGMIGMMAGAPTRSARSVLQSTHPTGVVPGARVSAPTAANKLERPCDDPGEKGALRRAPRAALREPPAIIPIIPPIPPIIPLALQAYPRPADGATC